jgi:hypothetical protein
MALAALRGPVGALARPLLDLEHDNPELLLMADAFASHNRD